MNRLGTTVPSLTLSLTLSMLSAAAFAGAEPKVTLEVSTQTAEFSFPVPRPKSWRWARAETDDNALEFRWEFVIRSGVDSYQCGFSLFKYPGSRAASGSLGALLKAGQASLWKQQPDGSSALIKAAKVSATAGDGCVIIRVSDPASIHLLFGHRPAGAMAQSRMPDADNATVAVPIRYRD
jgi:hypothetical protein